MIASRTGQRIAQRLARSISIPFHDGMPVAVATTTSCRNAQRHFHPSAYNAASTSHLGPLRPSMPVMAKKRSSTRVKAALDDEEDLADDDDEGTAFDVGSDYTETAPASTEAKVSRTRPQETFEETRARCQSKLRGIQEEGPETNIRLGRADWNDMVYSARSYDDLQSILEVRKDWNRLTSIYPHAIRSLSGRQARALFSRCQELRHPELVLNIIHSRTVYGFDFGLQEHRMLQDALLGKVLHLKNNKAKLSLAQVQSLPKAKSDLYPTDGEEKAGTPALTEEAEATDEVKNEQRETTELATRIRLSFIDQMMALSAATKIFSADSTSPDEYCVLLAIRGIIDGFKLNVASKSIDELSQVELLSRISRLLQCLSDATSSPQMTLNGDIQERNAAQASSSLAKFLAQYEKSLMQHHSEMKIDAILAKVETMMKECKGEIASSTLQEIASAKASLLHNVQQ